MKGIDENMNQKAKQHNPPSPCVIASIILLCGMLTGCGAPKGYSKAAAPIIGVQYNSGVSFRIFQQFPDLNTVENPEGNLITNYNQNFLYNGQMYCIESLVPNPKKDSIYSTWHWVYTVYKSDGEKIGVLTSNLDKGASSQAILICFLNEQYIYYQYKAARETKKLVRPTADGFYEYVHYEKYAFFRFNLETYENEEITLDLLFEKLVEVIPNPNNKELRLNPNYK